MNIVKNKDIQRKKLTHFQLNFNTMAEIIANSLEYVLTDGLSFKFAKTASYVSPRGSCTCHSRGSNMYSAVDGTKLIQLRCMGTI